MLRSVLAFAVIVATCAVGAAPAAAITIGVDAATGTDAPACGTAANPACLTIEYAIANIATTGDRIDVAPGVYAGPVVVDKQVILAGAQFGVDARTRAVPLAQESVITGGEPSSSITVTATGAIVDGFQVSGNTATAGMYTYGSGSRYRIRNTIFTDNVFGLYLNAAAGEDTVVLHNRFQANNRPGAVGGTGIYADSGSQNIRLEENRFTQNDGPPVNFAAGSLQGVVQDQIAISRNDFIGENSLILVGADDVTVSDNLFDGGGFDAVSVSGGSSDVAITGNTMRGKGRDAVRVRDPFGGGPNRGIRVTGNSITGSAQAGIHVLAGAMLGSLVASGNRIAGNAGGGVVNEDDDPLSAENDWWGCNTGPNTAGCDTTSSPGGGGSVDAGPWLVLSASAAPGSIGAGGQLAAVTAGVGANSDGFLGRRALPVRPDRVHDDARLDHAVGDDGGRAGGEHADLGRRDRDGDRDRRARQRRGHDTRDDRHGGWPGGTRGPGRRDRRTRPARRHGRDRPSGPGRHPGELHGGADRHLLPAARSADVRARRRVHHRPLRGRDRPILLRAAAHPPGQLAERLAARAGVVPRARRPLAEDRGAARLHRAAPRARERTARLERRTRRARSRRGRSPPRPARRSTARSSRPSRTRPPA